MTDSLREFAADMRRAADSALPEAARIIKRGAVNIKNQMRQDAQGHRHFTRLGPSIGFDITDGRGLVAEIGPTKGVLAGIAYFGSSRPGGATVADPKIALDAEAPVVERLIGDAAMRSLR